MTHAPHRISGELMMHVGIRFIGIRVRDIGGVSGYKGYRVVGDEELINKSIAWH
jgi:hypothetical protein